MRLNKINALYLILSLILVAGGCTDGIWIDYYEDIKEDCQFYVPQRGFRASDEAGKLWTVFDYIAPEEYPKVTPGNAEYDSNYVTRGQRCLHTLQDITQEKWAAASWKNIVLNPEKDMALGRDDEERLREKKKRVEALRIKILESLQVIAGTPIRVPDDKLIMGTAPIPKEHIDCIYSTHLSDLVGCVFRTLKIGGRYSQYYKAKDDELEDNELYQSNKNLFNYVMNRLGIIIYDPASGNEKGSDGKDRIFLAHYSYQDRSVAFTDYWWNMDMTLNSPYRRTQVLVHETRHAELGHFWCDLSIPEKDRSDDDKNCDETLEGSYGIGESYGAVLLAGSGLPLSGSAVAPLSADDITNVGNLMCRDAQVKFHESRGLKEFFTVGLGCKTTACCETFNALDYLEFSGIDTDLLNLTPDQQVRYERDLLEVNLGFDPDTQIESCATDIRR